MSTSKMTRATRLMIDSGPVTETSVTVGEISPTAREVSSTGSTSHSRGKDRVSEKSTMIESCAGVISRSTTAGALISIGTM